MGGSPDEIEQAFYEALNNADIAHVMACWAEEDEIAYIPANGQRYVGPGSIRSAFEARFAGNPLPVRPERIHKIEALASVVHHLIERVCAPTAAAEQAAWHTVTSVYHKTPQGWRLVAHHISPAAAQVPQDPASPAAVLH